MARQTMRRTPFVKVASKPFKDERQECGDNSDVLTAPPGKLIPSHTEIVAPAWSDFSGPKRAADSRSPSNCIVEAAP
jgi:hypothetical protein